MFNVYVCMRVCMHVYILLSELAQLVSLPYSQGRSTGYSDRSHDFFVTITRCYKDVYFNSLFPHTA